jgi:uncharacterized membrane protein YtjA (UPF0391 family)
LRAQRSAVDDASAVGRMPSRMRPGRCRDGAWRRLRERLHATCKPMSADSHTKTGVHRNAGPFRAHYDDTVNQTVEGEEKIMLKWALFFAVVAVIAGLLGFTGVAAGAAAIAKFLFVVFLILCVVFLVLGFVVTKKIVD